MAHIDHIQMLRNVQEWTSSRDLAIKSIDCPQCGFAGCIETLPAAPEVK